MSIMKEYLDYLRKKYETVDFIKDDPVQFLHSFKNDVKNLEIWGFIVSLFAFGKREAFIQKLNVLFEIMNHNPYEFILNFEKNESKLNGFIYRFYKDSDIKALFFLLSEKLKKGMTLGDIFYEKRNDSTLEILKGVYNEFETASAFFIFIVLSVFFKLIFSNFCVLMGDIVIFYSLIYNIYILSIY